MKQYSHLAVSLLIAGACAVADRSIPTAPSEAAFCKQPPPSSTSVTDLGTLGGTTSNAVPKTEVRS
jgi:hypothetical protein